MQVTLGLSISGLVLYALAEGFAVAALRKNLPKFDRAAAWCLGTGLVVHFTALEVRGHTLHSVPYRDLPDSMSLFAWMLAASYAFLVLRHRESSTGAFLLPVVILFDAVALLARGRQAPPTPELRGSLFALHVTMAILGYAALTLAFVLAILYLIQMRQLRLHRMGVLFARLPALDVLDRLQRTSITAGVCALAVSATIGIVRARIYWGTIWDAKVLATFVTIVIYLGALVSTRLGWKGRRSALLSIVGFVMLLFSYTVVNLFFTQEHVFR